MSLQLCSHKISKLISTNIESAHLLNTKTKLQMSNIDNIKFLPTQPIIDGIKHSFERIVNGWKEMGKYDTNVDGNVRVVTEEDHYPTNM